MRNLSDKIFAYSYNEYSIMIFYLLYMGNCIVFVYKDGNYFMKTVSDFNPKKYIYLSVKLIESNKLIAEMENIDYQPLMRNILIRFAEHEIKRIATVNQALYDKIQTIDGSLALSQSRWR